MENSQNCAYIQCLDTPIGIKLSRVFKLKNINFRGSMQNYDKQSQFLKLHGCFGANLIQQQELGLESHYLMMQSASIIILFSSEIGWTTQILEQIAQWQQNPQTKIPRKVILVNSSISNNNNILIKKFIAMVNRKLIVGSLLTHGLIYDSTFEFNNPLQTFINEIQQSKQLILFPQLDNQYLSFTSSLKVVLTIYRILKGQITEKQYDLIDIQLSFKEFNSLLEKMFLQQKPKPQAEPEKEPESDKKSPKRGSSSNKQQRPSQGGAPVDQNQQVIDDYCLANMLQFQVKQLTYAEMCKIVSLSYEQLANQSATEMSASESFQGQSAKSHCSLSQSISNKLGNLCNTSMLSNISLDCSPATIRKKAWDASGQYCAQSAIWLISQGTKQKREASSAVFDLKQFGSFLNYQESGDATIVEIQRILERQQLPPIVEAYTVTADLVGAFLLANLRRLNVSLVGTEAVNQTTKKAQMLENNEFSVISFASAYRWLLQFGEQPRSAEFWRGVVPEAAQEKMAIMARLLLSRGFSEPKISLETSISEAFAEILAGRCEEATEKGAKAPIKAPVTGDQPEQEEPEQENSYVIAVKLLLLLYVHQLDPRRNCVLVGFDTPEAIAVLELISRTTLWDFATQAGGERYMQYADPKKVPGAVQKGMLSYQNVIKDLNIKQYQIPVLNALLQAQRPGVAYVHSLNPLLHEIIVNRSNSRLCARAEVYELYALGAAFIEQRFGREAVFLDEKAAQARADFAFQFALPVCSVLDVSAQVLAQSAQKQQLANAYRLKHNATFRQVDPKAKTQAPLQIHEVEEVERYSHSILQQQFCVERLRRRYQLNNDEVVSRAILFGLNSDLKAGIVFFEQIMENYGVSGLSKFMTEMFNVQLALPSSAATTASPTATAGSDKPSVVLSADESAKSGDQSVNQIEDTEIAESEQEAVKLEETYVQKCYGAVFNLRDQYFELFEKQRQKLAEEEREAKKREKAEAAAYLDAVDADAETVVTEGDVAATGRESQVRSAAPGAPSTQSKTPLPAGKPEAGKGDVAAAPSAGDDVPNFLKPVPAPELSDEILEKIRAADAYFENLDLHNILINAFSQLILGAQVGLIENQLEFLGEQLLEVRRQQKEALLAQSAEDPENVDEAAGNEIQVSV